MTSNTLESTPESTLEPESTPEPESALDCHKCGSSAFLKLGLPQQKEELKPFDLAKLTKLVSCKRSVSAVRRESAVGYKKVKIFSAYLGEVEVEGYEVAPNYVALQTIISGYCCCSKTSRFIIKNMNGV